MIKRLCIYVLSAVLLCTFIGCAAPAAHTGISIVCANFPAYDFLREITAGSEEITLTLLLKAGQESHDYDPSSKDIAAIHAADIFVYGGGISDGWIDNVLSSVDTTDKTVIALTSLVPPLATAHDHQDGLHQEVYDEHVHTAPANAITIASALADAVYAKVADSTLYYENTATFIANLQALDADFKATVAAAENPTIVMADRFPLAYFCKAYGITYHAAFAGCSASVEPSSGTVQTLINTVQTQALPIVFQSELSDGKLAKTVADATGAQVRTLYACHNISKTDFDNGEGYLSLMRKNLAVLKEAWSV